MAAAFSGGKKMAAHLDKIAQNIAKGDTLRVGFLETAKYASGGESVAQVAFWNEYGTKTAPARPFFRSMIERERARWGAVLAHFMKMYDCDAQKALQAMGGIMQEQLRDSITETTSPALSPVTVMIRKLMQGKTDQKAPASVVWEAHRRVADGESVAGVNAKPLEYSGTMKRFVEFDIQGGTS